MKQKTQGRIPSFVVTAFAMPGFVSAIMIGNAAGVLPGIYAKYFGLDMAVIGTILLATKIFDAFTDPLIGYLSDHTKTRFGARKPWVVVGYALCVPAVYMLFVPMQNNPSPLYFLFWYMTAYLAWTMAEIPYAAWQTELSQDYNERTRIAGFRNAAANAGCLCYALIPLLPIFATTEITPQVLKVSAGGVAVLLPVFVILMIMFVPQGPRLSVKESFSIPELLKSVWQNKPFGILLASFSLSGIAFGMHGALSWIYLDTYLLVGDKYIYCIIGASVVGLVCIPLWLKIMSRFGKHRPFAMACIIPAMIIPLIVLIKPGPLAWIPWMVLFLCKNAMFTSFGIAPMAMLADTVDYDLLKTGVNRAGQYTSFTTMVQAMNIGIGNGIGFLILDIFDYDATITQHSASSVFGLQMAICWVPGLLFLFAGIIIWFFPLNEYRQIIIKKRIERRSIRKETRMAASADLEGGNDLISSQGPNTAQIEAEI